MEKIIIVWEKELLSRMDIIKSIIALNTVSILIIDPKDKDYEEIIKEAHNNSDLILNEPIPEKFKKDTCYYMWLDEISWLKWEKNKPNRK